MTRENALGSYSFMPHYLSFALSMLLIELTPGPNMSVLVLLTLERGQKAGLALVAGIALGLSLNGLICVLGMGTLLKLYPLLGLGLKWVGIAYLLYIGLSGIVDALKALRGKIEAQDSPAPPLLETSQSLRLNFTQGLLTNLFNPKAYLLFITVLPEFIDPKALIWPQALSLGLIYILIATSIHLGLVGLALKAKAWLGHAQKGPKLSLWLNAGLILVALSLSLKG